jgi:hypothetical protein
MLGAFQDHGITEVIYWRNANVEEKIPTESRELRTSLVKALAWLETREKGER